MAPKNSLVRGLLNRGKGAASRAKQGVSRRLGRAREAEGPFEVAFEGRARGPVERGETLLRAAIALDVDLDHFCGGNSSCGTCRVHIVSGREHLSRVEGAEEAVLGTARDRGDRLACQARVLGPVEVRVPEFFGV
jgi:ferredoxin